MNVPFKWFSPQEIVAVFEKHVRKPVEYFTRLARIEQSLTEDEKRHWMGKDVPRLYAWMEFRQWIKHYNIQTGKKLFATCAGDIELRSLNYEEIHLFDYEQSQKYDLHTLEVDHQDFDLVVFNQTLEHTYNPFMVMQRLFRVLKPGGYLYTTVPTINMPHLVPYHFWGITPMGMCMLSMTVGFNVCECGYWGNKRYMEQIFANKIWPDYTQVKTNGEIENDFHCQAQTWILARKPAEPVLFTAQFSAAPSYSFRAV
jgi:SAM-dependent methyltransferase